jgi:predicted transcriptional regulator of viral defense system
VVAVSEHRLPATFSYAQARTAGMSKRQLYGLRDAGKLETIGRGMYRRADAPVVDVDLLEAAHRAPEATLCLGSALAQHNLSDIIPAVHELALPRGRRHPAVTAPVRWHSFDPSTFEIGRQQLRVDAETSIGLYSASRTVIDVYRLRDQEGTEVAHEALRRWLARRDSQPSTLLTMARHFPQAQPALRHALEVLL